MSPLAPNILLIVDDDTLGEITAFRLELMGYAVTRVSTVEEALSIDETLRPGLTIVDVSLDPDRGMQFVERLASEPPCANSPILLLSGSADLEDVQKAFAAGCRDYLVTPYDPAVLTKKLDRWLPLV